MNQTKLELAQKITYLQDLLEIERATGEARMAVIRELRDQIDILKTGNQKQLILIEKLTGRSLIQRIFNRGKVWSY